MASTLYNRLCSTQYMFILRACSFKKKKCRVDILLGTTTVFVRYCEESVSDLWLLASLQIHVLEGGEIRVYSRNSENNTSKYPDIIARMPKVVSTWMRCPVLSSTSYGAFLLYIGFEGLCDILCHWFWGCCLGYRETADTALPGPQH